MRTSPYLRLLPLAAVLVLAAACTTTGTSSGRSGGNTLTQEDLAEYSSDYLYEAIRRLRPTWLRGRSGSPEVVVDGMRRGDTDVLRQIPVQEVGEVRYLSSGDATTRYGTGFPNGAIEVDSRR